MLHAAMKTRRLPHVIVVGNEKGGSGKTTIAAHIALALMKSGQRVASIDLDSRQRTLTHYIENRRGCARRRHMELELPMHFAIARAETANVDDNEAAEFAEFEQAIAGSEHGRDFLEVDVLARLDPVTLAPTGVSHYAELVREMRQHRRMVNAELTDWVVVNNRLSPDGASAKPVVWESLQELALTLGFRLAAGLHERPIYRDLFPRGLSALDTLANVVPPPDPVHSIARQEVQ